MKKLIALCLILGFTAAGCAAQKQIEIQNALARIAGRNMGYRVEEMKAMANSQIIGNPVMTADLLDLTNVLTPNSGIFNSSLDKAIAEGYQDGVNIFHGKINQPTQ